MNEKEIMEFKHILEDGFKKATAAILTLAYYQANSRFMKQSTDYPDVFEIYRYYMTRV